MADCCNERPNFGHPTCIKDLGTVVRFIFTGANNSTNAYNLAGFDKETLLGLLYDNSEPDDLWRPFPIVNNFEWTPAESQFAEASNGKKSFLRNGKTSIACETWDADATAKIIAKLQAMRCQSWGLLLVTDNNLIVGSRKVVQGVDSLVPIKIDEQSIEALFQFKTDAMTQSVKFNFDLDRNFDVSTLYAINGDLIWDATNEVVYPVDFVNDLPNIVDCQLTLSDTTTLTQAFIAINDDYRQGTRIAGVDDLGNVTGLTVANFLVENITDLTTITPTSIVEEPTGNFIVSYTGQTSGDKMKVSLVTAVPADITGNIVYQGSISYVIP